MKIKTLQHHSERQRGCTCRVQALLLISLLTMVSACATTSSDPAMAMRKQRIGPGQITPAAIQSEVMGFADSYSTSMADALDQIAADSEDPKVKAAAQDLELDILGNSFAIAVGANPIVSLLDMHAMVLLQGEVIEKYYLPEVFGELGQRLLERQSQAEAGLDRISRLVLTDRQRAEFDQIVDENRQRLAGQVYVGSMRLSEFAAARGVSQAQVQEGGNLLSLVYLDPLSNLSPAASQILQTRLLGERIFYYAKRVPVLMNWEAQSMVRGMAAMPESQQFVQSAERLTMASEQLAETADGLPGLVDEQRTAAIDQAANRLSAERQAAIDQAAVHLSAERQAAIDQVLQGFAAEREVLLNELEQGDEQMRGLLSEFRLTFDSGGQLLAALQATIGSIQQMTSADPAPSPSPEKETIKPEEIRSIMDSATQTVDRLNELVARIGGVLESPAWDARTGQFGAGADRVELSAGHLIDHTFRRGMIMIVTFLVGSVIAMLTYRFAALRFLPAPAPSR